MKKTTKYIIITLVIVLVLGGAFAALYFTDPNRTAGEEESSSSEAADGTALITKDKAEVSTVDVKNAKGEFTIVQTEKVQEASSAESSESEDSASSAEPTVSYEYTVKGFEQYPVNSSNFETAVYNACSLTAMKDLGEVENLADYGLTGENASVVTVHMKDGSTETFTAGIAGGETAGNYILYKGKVYIGTVNSVFQSSMYDNFTGFGYSIEDVDNGDGLGAHSLLEKMNLSGTAYSKPIKMVYDEKKAQNRMTEPVDIDCNLTVMDTLTTALKTISSTVVLANATESDLEKYGLKTPYATIEFTLNGESHTMTVSEQKVDGKRYMLAEGDKTIIYAVDDSAVSEWVGLTSLKLRNSYVFLPMIANVDDFTVEADGKTCKVDLSRTVNEEKSSDEQKVYDYTATKNGKDVEYENVTKFYMAMISIAVLSDEELPYTGKPEAKFTFNYYEGGQDVLEYYRANDDRLVAVLNGTYTATVRSTSIGDFVKALDDFMAK